MTDTARDIFDGPEADEDELTAGLEPALGAGAEQGGEEPASAILPSERSPLEALEAGLAEKVVGKVKVLDVPERPGWQVQFGIPVDATDLEKWKRQATRRVGRSESINELKLALLIIANACKGILIDGKQVPESETSDEPLVFKHRKFLDLAGAGHVILAVRKFYASDGHVMTTADEITRLSGYGDDSIAGDASDPI